MVFGPFLPLLKTPYFSLEEASANESHDPPYYRITGPDSVIACLLDQSDRFVMVRQYRPNLEMFTLETPAGGVEPPETPLAAVRREIAEETGLACAILPLARNFRLMMNRSNIRDHLFFGMFPEPIVGAVRERSLEVLRVPRNELLRLTNEGKYLQLAALGLLQVAGGVLSIDMWRAPIGAIEQAFRENSKVQWPE